MKPPDRRGPALAVSVIALAGVLAASLYPSGESTDPPAATIAAPAPRAAAAEPPPALVPPPSAEGLRLYGLLGAGAIIGLPNGVQRWVLIGRDVIPGLRLQQIRQHSAVLVSSAGIVELSLDGRVTAARAAPPPTAAGGSRDSTEGARDEILRYRFGLAPQRAGDRIAGFSIRPGADLPVLRRAGLQPGDVIVSVNGQSFDSQERVQELASEIAGSFTAEFEFVRGGRRMRTSLEVNPRN